MRRNWDFDGNDCNILMHGHKALHLVRKHYRKFGMLFTTLLLYLECSNSSREGVKLRCSDKVL